MNRVDGRVAIVTGGTQGLGAAVAEALAEGGAAGLVLCGRQAAKGEAVAARLTGAGCRAVFVPADLARVEDCATVIDAARETFGRAEILVNAAGLTDRGDILTTTPELFDRMVAVNVRAPFFLMQGAIRLMIDAGTPGAIVNIGSMSSRAGQPFLTPYSMSKGALATLTRNVAFQAMRNGIRVNQLDIGWMATEGEDRIQRDYHGAAEDWLAKAAAGQPFGRLLDPAEVARAVRFLASDDAGMMTGAVINFDQSVWGAYDGGAPAPGRALS